MFTYKRICLLWLAVVLLSSTSCYSIKKIEEQREHNDHTGLPTTLENLERSFGPARSAAESAGASNYHSLNANDDGSTISQPRNSHAGCSSPYPNGDRSSDHSGRPSNNDATPKETQGHPNPSATPFSPDKAQASFGHPTIPKSHFESIFKNPKNLIEEKNGYVSIDNLHVAPGSRLIIPKDEKPANIFSLLEDPVNSDNAILNLFYVISEKFNTGLEQHHSIIASPIARRPLEVIVMNTKNCCSIPYLLHVQLFSGHNYAPYDHIGEKNFTPSLPIYQNNSFAVYDIPTPNKTLLGTNGTGMVVLLKDPSKSFEDFFNLLQSDTSILKDYTATWKWFKDGHPHIRSFMIPSRGAKTHKI